MCDILHIYVTYQEASLTVGFYMASQRPSVLVVPPRMPSFTLYSNPPYLIILFWFAFHLFITLYLHFLGRSPGSTLELAYLLWLFNQYKHV